MWSSNRTERSEMGRRIYIDLGANKGGTVADFLSAHPAHMVFAFEPTPSLAASLRGIFSGPDSRVHVMECAAWIYDGIVEFYFGEDSNESSTILRDKIVIPGWRVDYTATYRAQAIDFDRWLRENTSEDDDVTLKMDIEGAEYKVLARCLDSGSLRRIGRARIEWHWNRYPGTVTLQEHERIRNAVKAIIPVEDWI
jgi:FkbM family methyltransferase